MFRATSAASPSSSTDPGTGAGPAAGKRTATERLRAPSTPAARPGASGLQDGQGLDPPAAPSATTHVVGAGESVPLLAARFGVTVDALLAANPAQIITVPGMSGPVRCFRAGDTIVIPAAAPDAPAADAPAADAAAPEPVVAPSPAPVGGAASVLSALGGIFSTVTEAIDAAFGWLLGPDGAPIPSTEVAPEAPDQLAPMPAPDLASGAGPAAPMTELSPAERGAQLSTMSPEHAADVDKFGFSADGKAAAIADGRWLVAKDLSTAIGGTSGDAFLTAADGVVASRAFVEDQQAVIASARAFAASPQPLDPAQEAHAAIPWDQAITSLDGNVLDPELRARLERFMRFVAWAGLVDGPVAKVGALRSPADAHRLSVAWMFNTATNTTAPNSLHKATNRRALADTLAAHGGADDRDTWLAPATVAEIVARRDDDDALRTYLFEVAAPEATQVQFQSARAAEGYPDAARRHPNVWPGTGVSMHPGGLAVDLFPAWTLNNLFDPLIDAIALYFGLVRTVKDDANSPEHWHYERVGTPPAPETE